MFNTPCRPSWQDQSEKKAHFFTSEGQGGRKVRPERAGCALAAASAAPLTDLDPTSTRSSARAGARAFVLPRPEHVPETLSEHCPRLCPNRRSSLCPEHCPSIVRALSEHCPEPLPRAFAPSIVRALSEHCPEPLSESLSESLPAPLAVALGFTLLGRRNRRIFG